MNRIYLLRLALDALAATLLIAALAYYWLDNRAHELIGAALALLLGLHGWFNRRWYAALTRGRYDARRRIAVVVNLGLLAVLGFVTVTGVMVSRSLFAFLGVDAGFGAREAHMFAAYWAVALLGVHLGLNWGRVMAIGGATLGARRSAAGVWAARAVAALIAVQGIRASFEITFGTKLSFGYALDMWDFNAETPRFFLNYAAILGLYATLTHLGLALLRRRRERRPTRL